MSRVWRGAENNRRNIDFENHVTETDEYPVCADAPGVPTWEAGPPVSKVTYPAMAERLAAGLTMADAVEEDPHTRVVGLICSSAAAAGPGFEKKGASSSRLASQTAAPRPETSGHTTTAVLLLDLEDDGHVKQSAGG